MYSESFSAAIFGIDGCVVHIETDISEGLPGLVLVGYLSSEVKESIGINLLLQYRNFFTEHCAVFF